MNNAVLNVPSMQPEFLWIFATPLVVLLVKTAFKYVTKIAVFVQEKPDPAATRAAHFDCLRTGLDLAIIGLVATVGTVRLSLKTSQQGHLSQLATVGIEFILVQMAFVAFSAFLSAIFYSPEKHFWRGVLFPTPLGCVSIYAGAVIFQSLMSPNV
jgi:hypothetical protein